MHLAVALDRGAHLLGARSHHQRHRGVQAVRFRLLRDVGGATHVLVGRVGAAADQRGRDRVRERVGRIGDLGRKLADRPGAIRRVGSDDVRLELGQIELDDDVVVLLRTLLDFLVRREQRRVPFGERHQRTTPGRPEIRGHLGVEREHRGRRPELGAHVGDRGLAGGADRARARADVLDDRVRSA